MKHSRLIPITELLTEIIDNRGKTVPTSDYGTPLIATNCIKDDSIYPVFEKVRYVSDDVMETWFRAHLKPNDILFVNKGTPGRVALVPDPVTFCAAQDMMGFRVNDEKINFNYLFAVLRSNSIRKFIENNHVGLVIPHFRKQELKFLNIPVPSRITQDAIGSIYTDISKKIHLNNQVNAELEKLAKTIYNYWFVQFDFPDAQGRPYKSSGGEMVYDARLGREIPAGWGVKELSYWIADNKGGDWGKDEEQGNYTTKVNCIRGADINGLNGSGEIKSPVRFILEKNEFKILRPGELVVEISGGSPTQSTGRMAYITEEVIKRFDNPLICSNFCKALTLKSPTHLFNFAQIWNRLYDNDVFFGFEGKTSGIKNFMFDSFVNSYLSVIPSESVISSYYDIANTIEIKKQKALQENAHLTALRDWLLPLLMNGQVGVRE